MRIAAAADLALAFGDIKTDFEEKSGKKVEISFGSTGLLAKQIAEGAPFDVFAAANVSFVDDVVKAGACDASTKVLYARGRIVLWSKDAELLEHVNSTEYGLAAYVFSRDVQRALRIAEATEAGMVGINRGLVSDPASPFGGLKQSGLGREGAREGLEEFTETQYFSLAWPA